MKKSFAAFGVGLLVAAAPAWAQDAGQAASGTPSGTETGPAKPERPTTGSAVQIDVTPLVRSLIKRAIRPRPKPALEAADPINPPDAAAAGAAAPADVPAVPAIATQSTPPPVAASQMAAPVGAPIPPPRPRVIAAAATSKPSPPTARAADRPPIVPTFEPQPSAPPAPVPPPEPSAPVASLPADPSSAQPVSVTAVEPASAEPSSSDREWLIAAVVGLLALAIAAATVGLRHRRIVQRTRSMLRIEPRLDVERGRCRANGLALAGGGAARG